MADIKSLNGLASANIKSINGIAIASVKSYNGLLIPASGWDISLMSEIKTKLIDYDTNTGIFFKSDGTKMYINNYYYNKVYQYSLSTAWNVSTASYDSVYSTYIWGNSGLFFNSSGTKVYSLRNNGYIKYVTLSTAWDISTDSSASTVDITSQTTNCWGLYFKPDGTKVYVTDNGNDRVYQYSLETAWDMSTISYDSKYYGYSSQITSQCAISFNPNGSQMFLTINGTVYQYSLSTPWDVSTASYDSIYGSGTSGSVSCIYIQPNNPYIYLLYYGSSQYIRQYSF